MCTHFDPSMYLKFPEHLNNFWYYTRIIYIEISYMLFGKHVVFYEETRFSNMCEFNFRFCMIHWNSCDDIFYIFDLLFFIYFKNVCCVFFVFRFSDSCVCEQCMRTRYFVPVNIHVLVTLRVYASVFLWKLCSGYERVLYESPR
jgi:hypothetical protein